MYKSEVRVLPVGLGCNLELFTFLITLACWCQTFSIVSLTWVQWWRFWQTRRMMSPISVLWLLIYMHAFHFWLKHSLYDFPFMTMLYFSGFQKRKDESSEFNCNNLQTLSMLRNTSGIAELVNDSHPLWKRIHRNPKHLPALCCGHFNYNYKGFKNTNYMQFIQLYWNVFFF